MKKIFYVMAVTAMVIVSCQPKTEPVAVDLEAEKAAINELFDKYYAAYDAGDIAGFTSFLTEDALCIGSDPSEFFTKEQFADLWEEMFGEAEGLPRMQFISEPEIKLAADGNSATVIHQYVMPDFMPINARNAYHVVNDGGWKILVLNCSFIPYNEDLPKVIVALE